VPTPPKASAIRANIVRGFYRGQTADAWISQQNPPPARSSSPRMTLTARIREACNSIRDDPRLQQTLARGEKTTEVE